MEITQELLHELFEYRNGELYWKIHRGAVKAGTIAGHIDNTGYKRISINKKLYRNHRLIFLMYIGKLPKIIDHINGNKLDNRIENLREATHSENLWNQKLARHNTSGAKGVAWHTRDEKWYCSIKIGGKQIYLGYYSDFEEAKKVVEKARNKYHGEFANNGKQDEKVST